MTGELENLAGLAALPTSIEDELCLHGRNRPLSAPPGARFGGGARPQARSAEDGRVGAALFAPGSTPIYSENLYERVTAIGSPTAHRYYVHSPERLVAIVTRGGAQPGTRYVHVDHLGSVDALTDEGGAVVERRSYDPFGQRRNPVWGQPPPASFISLTTQGFTGHESDEELGLMNMKGRIFDPKVGRFLTTDPIVAAPFSGQGWNPYSYVLNRPLGYVDPSGFEPTVVVETDYIRDAKGNAIGLQAWYRITEEPSRPPKNEEGPREAAENEATARPVDVGTTGNASGYVPQPVTTAPPDWSQNPYVQVEGGFLGGLALGVVPFAGVGQQLLDAGDVLPHGTPEARRGLAVGQIVGGIVSVVGGITGEVLGGAATACRT